MAMFIKPETVRLARESANINRDTAASIAVVSRRTWDSWETGQRNMPENAFRYFISQVTGAPLVLEKDTSDYKELLVFFDYSGGHITPVDVVSPEVFIAVEDEGEDMASVISMTRHADGTRLPRKTIFTISDNRKNYNRLKEWSVS